MCIDEKQTYKMNKTEISDNIYNAQHMKQQKNK